MKKCNFDPCCPLVAGYCAFRFRTSSQANGTFTFVPAVLPLADHNYTVNLIASDIYGNAQNISFTFTIDTTPPAKPVITGGNVASGTLQARPAENTADQFAVTVTGTRDKDTSVLINGQELVAAADNDWSANVVLQPGANTVEIRLVDLAGNIGPSEWVDINMMTANRLIYQYNDAGRLRRIAPSN